MESATKGDDEVLSLEEAAWHLSSVANYDFGHVNVEFDDIRFDTLYAQITVTDGGVLLSSLGLAYEKIHTDIEKFCQSLNLIEKYVRFIDVAVSGNGHAVISLVTTFKKDSKGWYDYHWYYPNEYNLYGYADSICDAYFSDDSIYVWNDLGKRELVRWLNYTESHELFAHNVTVYYTKTREYIFEFPYSSDPYGSPSAMNSRLFGGGYEILKEEMCYYLDSYLGLGYKYLIDNPNNLLEGECPAIWSISCGTGVFPPNHLYINYHNLSVTYCCMHVIEPDPHL